MLRIGKKNHLKCSVKITKGGKRVEDKYRNIEQWQQIENSKKYGS
jgi:hypothetical protein